MLITSNVRDPRSTLCYSHHNKLNCPSSMINHIDGTGPIKRAAISPQHRGAGRSPHSSSKLLYKQSDSLKTTCCLLVPERSGISWRTWNVLRKVHRKKRFRESIDIISV
jgi:hypothetical protein